MNQIQEISQAEHKKIDACITIVSDSVPSAEGVHLDIVSESDRHLINKADVAQDENVLFLDANLSLLHPKEQYLKLMESIGIQKNKCVAELQGFTKYDRENGKFTLFPVVSGGSMNPYIKYRSNRACASRRLANIDNFCRLVKQKVFFMNFNLTFPKEISELLFADSKGKEKTKEIYNLFWKRLIDENILTLDDSRYETTKGLTLGIYSNEHDWSSKNPFEPHYHTHNLIPNFLLDEKNHQFVRIVPYIKADSFQFCQIKKLWYECQKEILHYGEHNGSPYSDFDIDSLSVVVYFRYFKGYTADLNKPDKVPRTLLNELEYQAYLEDLDAWKDNNRARCNLLHFLKYSTRSYLLDVAQNGSDSLDSYENNQIRFKQFVDKGCIQNKTSCKGFFKNLKRVASVVDSSITFSKKNMVANCCSVTGQKIYGKGQMISNFSDLGEIVVYMAYKSGLIRLGSINSKKSCTFVLDDSQNLGGYTK